MNKAALPSAFPHLAMEFAAICDCGGRLAGTDSEAKAVKLLEALGRDATGRDRHAESVLYDGWRAVTASLDLGDGASLPCHPLVRTVGTTPSGLSAEVLDLGRGAPEDFEREMREIPGRIVLVRHELMFSAGTIHRRLKYQAAVKAGAAGFLIAGPEAGSLVAGSSGRGAEPGIPAAGVSPETASRLVERDGCRPQVRLRIDVRESADHATNLFFDLPGRTDEWIVLSAHVDGHDLAESAMDNASGVAVALSVAREIARISPNDRQRGLRLALFNIEEWALLGSAAHVTAMTAEERGKMALNVNVDSVGYGRLTALTSNFCALEPFLRAAAAAAGVPLSLFRPTQRNSDHFNFADAGIPAFRLVAGFDDRSSAGRLVLTERDTRGMVDAEALASAARLTYSVVESALNAARATVRGWRTRAM